MKAVLVSAVIGVSVIFSAAMISGNLDFKKQNVIVTEGGHVNLGKVYSEKAVIDIKLSFANDNSKVFEITGVPYTAYQQKIDEEFKSILDDYNKDVPDDKKLTMSSLTFKVPSKVTIKAHTLYRAEFIPMFDLTIAEKEVSYEKNESIHKVLSESVASFVSANKQAYSSTMLINEK